MMRENQRVIVEADDIFFYLEMLKSIKPGRILDAGMFLKRIGAVSRQAMSYEIAEDAEIWGIDFFPETKLTVYQKIYDRIVPVQEFVETVIQSTVDEKFDIAVILNSDGWVNEEQEKYLWQYMLRFASAVATDEKTAKKQAALGRIKGYYPVSTDGTVYAWIPTRELRGEI